jgi:hypothetical protein
MYGTLTRFDRNRARCILEEGPLPKYACTRCGAGIIEEFYGESGLDGRGYLVTIECSRCEGTGFEPEAERGHTKLGD